MMMRTTTVIPALLAAMVFMIPFRGAPLAANPVTRAPQADEEPPKDKGEEAKENGEPAEEKEKKKKPPEKDRYFAIKGGTVHTVTNGDLQGVTILAKNGKIIEIGPYVDLPEDTQVLDATGFEIYPGLIAVTSGGILGSEPPDDNTNVYGLNMTIALAGGITTAVVGNTAAKLTYGSVEDILVKRDLFETLSYSTSDPNGRRELRAKFEKVRQYIRDLEAYEQEKKTNPDAEEPDKEWMSGEHKKILALMRKEAVAIMSATTAHEILSVCDLARRYGIDVVVRGAVEGWTVAPQMARAGLAAIVTPRHQMPRDDRFNRPNGSSIENAAILHRHGAQLAVIPGTAAITLWGLAGQDLLHLNMEAAFAVRGGLPPDAALRAITIDAARLLGISHRVGSIEVGKDADFVITDGDILYYMTLARWTVVNGRIAYDKQKETLFSHIRPEGKRDAPPPVDYWPRPLGGAP